MIGREQLIHELLLRWEERRERGEPVDLKELCAEHPDLLEDVLRQIKALKRLDCLLEADESSDVIHCPWQDTALDAVVPPLPQSIGRYKVLEELGRGGMGVVYRVLQPELKREAESFSKGRFSSCGRIRRSLFSRNPAGNLDASSLSLSQGPGIRSTILGTPLSILSIIDFTSRFCGYNNLPLRPSPCALLSHQQAEKNAGTKPLTRPRGAQSADVKTRSWPDQDARVGRASESPGAAEILQPTLRRQ